MFHTAEWDHEQAINESVKVGVIGTGSTAAQAIPELEAVTHHTKSHGERGAVREYCDTCEAFGHSTANCDEGETF